MARRPEAWWRREHQTVKLHGGARVIAAAAWVITAAVIIP
jgi:hypothetical protein